MKYIVIGLGGFGSQLASRLTSMGHEVIGADVNPATCDLLRDSLTGIVCLNASSQNALQALPLLDADVVVVAIGRDFGSSVQTVAQLRRAGVRRIIARGFNDVHIGVLQVLGVEKIVFSERDGAESLAQSLIYGDFVSSYQVDPLHYVMQFIAPHQIVGLSLDETNMWKDYGLKVIAIKKVIQKRNQLGLTHSHREVSEGITPTTVIEAGDMLVVYGALKSYDSFIRHLR